MSELFAAVVAVILSILYTHWNDRQREEEQERSARRMLSLEVDRNLLLAAELKQTLDTDTVQGGSLMGLRDEEKGAYIAEEMLNRGQIPWSQTIWTNNVGMAARAVPTEQAVSLFTHHGHIERMKGYEATLTRLRFEQEMAPERVTHSGKPSFRVRPFSRNAHINLEQLLEELLALIALGNPITLPEPSRWKRARARLPGGKAS